MRVHRSTKFSTGDRVRVNRGRKVPRGTEGVIISIQAMATSKTWNGPGSKQYENRQTMLLLDCEDQHVTVDTKHCDPV